MSNMRLLQSLNRGLETLDYLATQVEPSRLTDIAAHLDVDKSNASHLLRTLVAAGYAEQTDGRRYRATSKVLPKRGHDLEEIIACREALHQTLVELVDKTGECAHMAVLVGTRVWYVDKITSPLPLKVDHPIGSLAPLHCTALGKAFLAFGNAPDAGLLEPFTPKTITKRQALASEIEATRRRGYAQDDEEFSPGIRCAAVPVHTGAGEMIAAIGISGPTARISLERLDELGSLVRDHLAATCTWSKT
jgi:DNA-binding IclR family transcriptional regulator